MLAAYLVQGGSHMRPSPCPLSEPKYLWEKQSLPWGEGGSLLNKWCFLIASILESMERKFDVLDTHADR